MDTKNSDVGPYTKEIHGGGFEHLGYPPGHPGPSPSTPKMPPGTYQQTGVFEMGCDSGGTPIVAEAHADEFCEQLQQERPNMRLRFDEWRLIHAGIKAAILYGVAWERTSYVDVPVEPKSELREAADANWAEVGRGVADVIDPYEPRRRNGEGTVAFLRRLLTEEVWPPPAVGVAPMSTKEDFISPRQELEQRVAKLESGPGAGKAADRHLAEVEARLQGAISLLRRVYDADFLPTEQLRRSIAAFIDR